MKKADVVSVKYPSFPKVKLDRLLKKPSLKKRWQVLCGDKDHWRIGLYSPEFKSVPDIERFEKHTCPEYFMLVKGNVSLALLERKAKKDIIKIVKLKPFQPILAETWHCGFCPDGKHTGSALVVERDQFTSYYVDNPLGSLTK